jgi:hypothetical protein
MRPVNQLAREQLPVLLARRAAVSAPELAAQLGVSSATLHRMLGGLGAPLLSSGQARRTRYALRRPLRGKLADLPLYAVDEAGRAQPLGPLALLQPQGCHLLLDRSAWPVPDEAADGWWDGLPYPLFDLRPQGYMGRQLARAQHRLLGVSANPDEWSDDDVLQVLSQAGADGSGHLILGDAACERWLASQAEPAASAAEPVDALAVGGTRLGAHYAALAELAVATGVPGSSAAGEFPKFAAQRTLAGSATPHVLVKFSGADGSPAVRRWADLLVCEHLALTAAAALPGVQASASRIVQHAGRTFLEAERFDRLGRWGRSPLLSLATVNAALLGDASTDWTLLARRLVAGGWLSADDEAAVQRLWWFGRLIANTDMHTGNLSLRPVPREGGGAGALQLAPAYDMLPMRYAPLPGGEVPLRDFEPALPLPPLRAVWLQACAAALAFWQQAAQDTRISGAFQALCAANAQRLARVAERV